jgi:hypothetical protein
MKVTAREPDRLERQDGRPGKRRLAAALSAFLMCGCLHGAGPADSLPPRSPEPVSSSWSGGKCEYSGGRLRFSRGAESSAIRLDVGVPEASGIICSEEFTVILTQRTAVLSMGANGIMSGYESLGCFGGEMPSCSGGHFVAANSIEINLAPIDREDGGRIGERLSDGVLYVTSAKGRTWAMALADPFAGWNIY